MPNDSNLPEPSAQGWVNASGQLVAGVSQSGVLFGNGLNVTGPVAAVSVLGPSGLALPGAEALTSGEAIYPRVIASGSAPLATGTVALTYWTAATSGTATTVTTQAGGTAAAGLTYAAVGVYSVAANGNLTLLASTADLHTTLWIATYTTYASALSSSFVRVAGQRYAVGFLAVGTTPPVLAGTNPGGTFTGLSPILAASVTGQATLPASVAAGSLSAGNNMPEAVVSP
jgi:hypothetical protein